MKKNMIASLIVLSAIVSSTLAFSEETKAPTPPPAPRSPNAGFMALTGGLDLPFSKDYADRKINPRFAFGGEVALSVIPNLLVGVYALHHQGEYDVIKNIDFGVTDYGLEVIGASEVALSNLKLHVFGDARVGRARLSVTKAVVPDTMTTAGLGGGINSPLTEAIILSPNLQYTHYFKLTSPKQNSFDTMDVLATVKFLF